MQKPQWMDDTGELIASLSLSFAKLLCHLVLLIAVHTDRSMMAQRANKRIRGVPTILSLIPGY